jgi:hypothetical protein
METGTEIILQRMKDCPEEFVADRAAIGMSKWERIIGEARDYLPKEDIEALDAGYKQMKIDLFNEKVLKTLAGEVDVEQTITYKAKERYAGGFTDARGLFGGAAVGFAPVKAEGQMINEHLDAHRLAILSGGTK